MSFNNFGGPFNLSVGNSVRVWITYNGNDEGAIWIQASTIGPGTVQSTNFAKSRTLNASATSTSVNYLCTVTALDDGGSGEGVVIFNLDGGGNN